MSPDDVQIREKLDPTVRRLRRVGLIFFALSSLFAVFMVYSALDLSVPFRINGVESHDVGTRVRAAALSFTVPLFAAFFAFCPRTVLEKLLRYQLSEMEKMKKKLGVK